MACRRKQAYVSHHLAPLLDEQPSTAGERSGITYVSSHAPLRAVRMGPYDHRHAQASNSKCIHMSSPSATWCEAAAGSSSKQIQANRETAAYN
eukprot:GHRR01032502.1.p3 GENE.GHRR01032502.1~~GHRR01032502.1.p3  ORF type:complete len:101 (+),score=14.95 GHRR01032502.1:26-304(+)